MDAGYLSAAGLQIFKVVVEFGSFRAAAQYLQISEPAVSAHIRRLEERVDARLFERLHRKKLRLTEAGQLLYEYALDISAETRELLALLEDLKNGERGEVSFALSVCKSLLCSIVASYLQQHPDVSLVFRTGNSILVKRLVRHGAVYFGVVQRPERGNLHSSLTSRPLFKEPMVLFCAKSHPLADKRVISKDDLAENKLITCLEGSDYNNTINDYLCRLGIRKKDYVRVEDGTVLAYIVERGGGLGILPFHGLATRLQQGTIVRLSPEKGCEPPNIEYQLIFRDGTRLNAATRLFLKHIEEEVARLDYKL